jgi:hypothetical protein
VPVVNFKDPSLGILNKKYVSPKEFVYVALPSLNIGLRAAPVAGSFNLLLYSVEFIGVM